MMVRSSMGGDISVVDRTRFVEGLGFARSPMIRTEGPVVARMGGSGPTSARSLDQKRLPPTWDSAAEKRNPVHTVRYPW